MTTRYEVVEPPDSDEDQDDWRGGWGVASAELSPEETFLREEFVRALEADRTTYWSDERARPYELEAQVNQTLVFETCIFFPFRWSGPPSRRSCRAFLFRVLTAPAPFFSPTAFSHGPG